MSIKRIAPLSLALLAAFALNAAAVVIDVFHTSDVHGWYGPRKAKWDAANSTRTIGGFATLQALIKADKNPYIVLDSGDMFQGTPEGIVTKGQSSVKLMNMLGYSAAVPGNHDYDYGEPVLQAMTASAAFPFLGANAYYKADGTGLKYLRPYTMLQKGGKKIAVLGLIGKHTSITCRPANTAHLDFRTESAEAAKWLPEILAQKPDAVVVIAHIGLSQALGGRTVDVSTWTFAQPEADSTLAVARAAKGIDLIMGGHQHTSLTNGYHDPVSGAWLAESGTGLTNVTRASLDFDDNTGKLKGITVKLVPLWTDVYGQDAEVKATIDGFAADVNREMGKPVGTLTADLRFSPDGLDSPIGDWLSDVTMQAVGADIGLQNTSGIRAEISAGTITLREIYQTMPFDNTVATMKLTGAQLKALMTEYLKGGRTEIQIAGFEAAFAKTEGGTDVRLTRNGAEIKPDDVLLAATNNYLAYGGGGPTFAAGTEVKDALINVRDVMIKAFAAGPVTPPATGRIKRLN